ncbi:ISAon1 family transposase [Zobellia galactanivorans]|uniref:Transposase, family 12 n=1 Tax=Zobellia galactanivorans (strain DSM 12802 / CCUG 47099 / CIP 106680 / NCIMB 13871 / Dsij) TaxID=63186 RepID=G0L589_ZOBGA|nr:Transposase, family 12 [Zobellia galactanivorans]CAZ98141.1 Transposase, family 12 [Zobellia galactanivorans]
MVSTKANDCHTIGQFYGVNGKKLQRQFRDYLSDFRQWKEKSHAKQWLIFPENIGPNLSIDETALSKGELYTIITNKKGKGKKGSIVAIFSGTKVGPIIEQLLKISAKKRAMVKEITLDMANSMKTIAKTCFPKAIQVTDRFHVQKLALEALQDIRIKHRWEAIDQENQQIKEARAKNGTFVPKEFSNGDTRKQLLARSRYLLYKSPNNWTQNQAERSKILFAQYPDIKVAFDLVQGLRNIFNTAASIQSAYTKLAHWYKDVQNTGFRAFNTIANTISLNYRSILNYFINRSTNASAESFNAKIKAFRAQFRGVKNVEFFLYRLTTIFA